MAVKRTSLLTTLANKQVEYNKNADASVAQAEYMAEQIEELKSVAVIDTNKAKAVETALGILSKAGVDF